MCKEDGWILESESPKLGNCVFWAQVRNRFVSQHCKSIWGKERSQQDNQSGDLEVRIAFYF